MPTDDKPIDASPWLAGAAIPREFAGMPPVNPRDRAAEPPEGWRGLAGVAADVDYYGRRVWDAALAGREGETAGGRSKSRRLAALAELVRQSSPYIVHDQIDHYSTGSSSPYATVERDIAAYADAVVSHLMLLVDACAGDWTTSATWAAHLRALAGAIQAVPVCGLAEVRPS